MIDTIGSNISSLQLLRAQNAFNQVKTSQNQQPEEIIPVAEEITEEVSLPKAGTTVEKLQNEIIDTIRNDLTSINDEITDEDIRYGLTFGRSVLVDCSA